MPQNILVIDLEATCDEGPDFPSDDMEIIEMGAVWASPDDMGKLGAV